MTRRLIWRFLVDRSGLILAFYLNTLLILILIGVVASYRLPSEDLFDELGYALLLSTVLIVLYLAADLARWLPFTRQAEALLAQTTPPEALASLPPGGTADQVLAARLVARIDSAWTAERLRFLEQHEQHSAFTNLWIHQMKTPVSAISLLAQDSAVRPAAELRSTIAAIEDEAIRVADGLELVLNMARLQDFAMDYHIRRTDLLAGVRQVINARRKQFIRLGIFPEIEADEAEWPVLTDDKWNRFVIDQVIANALKYGSQGGEPGQTLRFRLSRSGSDITLEIADCGPGIPPEDLPRVCEPFFTGENGRRFGGATGIGLYLVKRVTDQLGHGLEIRSVPGAGTTVLLTYKDQTLQN